MSIEELLVSREGPVLTVTFNRPQQRNAMTWAMYDGLYEACEQADSDVDVRALVLRGAGDKAFVAGTDIAQFQEFRAGEDGAEYERKIARILRRLEDVTVPTLAAVHGYCVGGGLALAAVCDLRVATRSARFGVPIARTLGNCLSMDNYALLVHHLGPARTLDLLLRARLLTGDQACAAGFVSEVCEDDQLQEAVDEVLTPILAHAPLSMWATKQAVSRLRRARLPAGDDLVQRVYGSEDFARAVHAFHAKEPIVWMGR